MSSAGINPLAILAPDLYAKQLAIQRRQALAQSLLEQGQSNMGSSPYGGLRSAGNAILGAYLAKNADKDTAALYAPQQEQPQSNAPTPLSQQDVPEPQISNMPGSGPSASSPSPQALGAALLGTLPTPQQQPPAAPSRPQRTIPSVMNDAIPALPGMTKQQSMLEYFQSPSDYWKSLAPTPEYRNALMAAGGDPEKAQAMLMQTQTKAGEINTTRGMSQIPDGQGGYKTVYAPPPAPAGYTYQQGQDGQPQLVPVAGGQQAVAGSALASRVPQALTTPGIGYDANNQPVASNALAMSGNAALAPQMGIGPQQSAPPQQQMPPQGGPNINANNPINMQPGGQQARYSTPTAGLGAAWDNLSHYGSKGINTVSKIVSTWAPYAPPDYVQNVARQLGVDPNQPLDLSNPNIKGALIDAMRPNETGTRYGPGVQSPQTAPLRPELPPGVAAGANAFSTGAGGAAGKEYADTKTLAADVPTRINVLQSILNLSKLGAPTGSTEWQNAARETAAALGQSLGIQVDANNPAALMTEIQKYMGQYSNRMSAGQPGTGSDKQLDAVIAANPHDTMFPATLQRVVPWIMANELGTKAKSNFLDARIQSAPNNPNAALSAQSDWRNTYQPRVAQFEMMTPQQQAGYLNDPRAFKNAADRLSFIQAAQKLHPYFKGVPGQ